MIDPTTSPQGLSTALPIPIPADPPVALLDQKWRVTRMLSGLAEALMGRVRGICVSLFPSFFLPPVSTPEGILARLFPPYSPCFTEEEFIKLKSHLEAGTQEGVYELYDTFEELEKRWKAASCQPLEVDQKSVLVDKQILIDAHRIRLKINGFNVLKAEHAKLGGADCAVRAHHFLKAAILEANPTYSEHDSAEIALRTTNLLCQTYAANTTTAVWGLVNNRVKADPELSEAVATVKFGTTEYRLSVVVAPNRVLIHREIPLQIVTNDDDVITAGLFATTLSIDDAHKTLQTTFELQRP
jgi:hypothetical protein